MKFSKICVVLASILTFSSRTDKTASAFIDSTICLSGEASASCSAIGLRTSFEQTVSNIVNFSRDEAAIKLYLAYYF